jgi:hypothetical protein
VDAATPDQMVIAPNLFELRVDELLKSTVIGQARELMGNGLALHLVVQLDVLQRERRASGAPVARGAPLRLAHGILASDQRASRTASVPGW